MAEDSGLTAKQDRFCDEYLIDCNATQAAIRSGYSEATAAEIGYENLRKPQIQQRIAARMSERAVRTRVTQDRVLSGIAEMAYYDLADAFDEKGALRAIHDMPPMLRNAIAGIEVQELKIGDTTVGHVKKVKLVDRKGSFELLGRHLKLFTDKVEHSADTKLEQIIAASMQAGAAK